MGMAVSIYLRYICSSLLNRLLLLRDVNIKSDHLIARFFPAQMEL